MSKIWKKFSELHGGNFLAREQFEELCYEFLDKHYPGKAIVSVNNLKESKSNKLNVIFLSKFFSNQLTNSRKGQIRKAFNNFLVFNEKKKIKTYNWVFCVSYRLNNEELMWWLGWKEKMTKKHGVNIEILDGDTIIERTKKYGLYNKWFETKEEETKETKEEKEARIDKVEKEIKAENNNEKKEVKVEKNENEKITEKIKEKEEKEVKIDKVEKETKVEKTKKNEEKETKKDFSFKLIPDKENKKIKKIIINKVKSINNKKVKEKRENDTVIPARKVTFRFQYERLNSQYNRIKESAKKLSKDDKTQLQKINSLKKWDNLFNINDDLNITTLKLFYKAKSYEIRKKYIHAVYVYEYIFKKDNYKEVLKFKLEESYKSLTKCQQNVQAILDELEGDIYFIKKNQIKAVEHYEKCHKLNKNNRIYAKKFYETLADSQIENDLPSEAEKNYKKALKNDKLNDALERKLQNAIYLSNGKKYFKSSPFSLLNVFVSPFAYWAAHSTIRKDTTREKLNTSSKKLAYVVATIMVLIVVVFFAFNNNFTLENTKVKQDKIIVQSDKFIKPVSIDDIAVAYGDKIMNNISYKKIHLIDTAIAAYNRALAYNPKNETAYQQLLKADDYKKKYLNNAQANILLDSAAYFISMRRSHENLRLFKYLFNPNDKSQGKYGFVDSNMQIVIPPVYDFNYYKMYKGNENFINGEAYICLVHSVGDTNYYKIDRENKFKMRL